MFRFPSPSPACRVRLGAGLFVLATAGACGGDGGGTTAVNAGVAGAYLLETVNGAALPYIVTETDSLGTFSVSLDSSTITLRATGTFTERLALRIIDPQGTFGLKGDINGTYKVTGSSLLLIATATVINGVTETFPPDSLNASIANNIITTSIPDTLSDGTILPLVSAYRRK